MLGVKDEGLGGRCRAVREGLLRGDQGELEVFKPGLREAQQRLERGNAAAGNDHAKGLI